jgi:hypothetical protein
MHAGLHDTPLSARCLLRPDLQGFRCSPTSTVKLYPGELYPHVGFIVTKLLRSAEHVAASYNKFATCEQWKAKAQSIRRGHRAEHSPQTAFDCRFARSLMILVNFRALWRRLTDQELGFPQSAAVVGLVHWLMVG